jgi:hypothetical protein
LPILILSLLIAATLSTARGTQPKPQDWKAVRADYDLFLRKPGSGHAKKLAKALPEQLVQAQEEIPGRNETLEYILDDQKWEQFKNIVRLPKPAYIPVMYRLMNITDEDYSSELESILGGYVAKLPEEFLKYSQDASDFQLRGIFGSFGDEDEDDARQSAELNANYAALEKVKNTKYLNIRNRCLDILKIFIEEKESRKE